MKTNDDKNKKIVGFTTGVFDMFHIGHLNIIKNAKSQCDHLIVGVSSDSLVASYKNKTPVIPQSERLEIVSALAYADEVVLISDRDKFGQYLRFKYDLLFVGDDWKGTSIFSELEDKLAPYGSKIVYFGYTNNISSTKLKKTIESLSEE